jgi:hypothetical protein
MFQRSVGQPAFIRRAKWLEESREITLAEPWALAAVGYVLVIAEPVFQDSSIAASQPRSPIPAGRSIGFERQIDLEF